MRRRCVWTGGERAVPAFSGLAWGRGPGSPRLPAGTRWQWPTVQLTRRPPPPRPVLTQWSSKESPVRMHCLPNLLRSGSKHSVAQHPRCLHPAMFAVGGARADPQHGHRPPATRNLGPPRAHPWAGGGAGRAGGRPLPWRRRAGGGGGGGAAGRGRCAGRRWGARCAGCCWACCEASRCWGARWGARCWACWVCCGARRRAGRCRGCPCRRRRRCLHGAAQLRLAPGSVPPLHGCRGQLGCGGAGGGARGTALAVGWWCDGRFLGGMDGRMDGHGRTWAHRMDTRLLARICPRACLCLLLGCLCKPGTSSSTAPRMPLNAPSMPPHPYALRCFAGQTLSRRR